MSESSILVVIFVISVENSCRITRSQFCIFQQIQFCRVVLYSIIEMYLDFQPIQVSIENPAFYNADHIHYKYRIYKRDKMRMTRVVKS